MKVEPTKEHRWLSKLLGEWTFETEVVMAPGQPAVKGIGTERVRSLGGVWTLAEGSGEMPDGGGVAHSVMTLGFDPQRGRFVGTFIASMMTHLWRYDGSLDAAGRVLTLDTEGPSWTGDGTAKYKDIIEIVSDDHRTLTSRMLGDDGQWHEFMKAHYRRKPL